MIQCTLPLNMIHSISLRMSCHTDSNRYFLLLNVFNFIFGFLEVYDFTATTCWLIVINSFENFSKGAFSNACSNFGEELFWIKHIILRGRREEREEHKHFVSKF